MVRRFLYGMLMGIDATMGTQNTVKEETHDKLINEVNNQITQLLKRFMVTMILILLLKLKNLGMDVC